MTDDNKRRVLSHEAREKLAHLERRFPDRPTEGRIRERRKLEEERSEEHLQYRETDSMAAGRRQAEHDAAWNTWFDTRFDARLRDGDGFLVGVFGTALAEMIADLEDEIDQHRNETRLALSDEVRKLRTELCELLGVVAELRKMLAADNTRALDLPQLPLARRVN